MNSKERHVEFLINEILGPMKSCKNCGGEKWGGQNGWCSNNAKKKFSTEKVKEDDIRCILVVCKECGNRKLIIPQEGCYVIKNIGMEM